LPWDGDLGHLEGDVAAVADDLGADLDQLLLQACQRPFLDGLRRRQRAQEVAEIVGECMMAPDSDSPVGCAMTASLNPR
jgi:hypothetical protein